MGTTTNDNIDSIPRPTGGRPIRRWTLVAIAVTGIALVVPFAFNMFKKDAHFTGFWHLAGTFSPAK